MPASLKDVAKLAGVGTTTASMILNSTNGKERYRPETVEKVTRAAKQLGYHTNHRARSFRGGATHILGLALDYHGIGRSPLADTYASQLAAGLQAGLWRNKYNLLMVTGSKEESAGEVGLRFIRQGRIDGLFLTSLPPPSTHADLTQLASKIVLLNREPPPGLSAVIADDRHGVELAVRHLEALGHRHIAWVAPAVFYDQSAERRGEAFATRCLEKSLKGELIRYTPEHGVLDYQKEGEMARLAGEAVRKRWNAGSTPTALLCYNLSTALGVYQALRSLGLHIPEDVSVVSFESAVARFFRPPATSVDLRWTHLAETAAELLIQSLQAESPSEPRLVRIAPELSAAESSAPKNS